MGIHQKWAEFAQGPEVLPMHTCLPTCSLAALTCAAAVPARLLVVPTLWSTQSEGPRLKKGSAPEGKRHWKWPTAQRSAQETSCHSIVGSSVPSILASGTMCSAGQMCLTSGGQGASSRQSLNIFQKASRINKPLHFHTWLLCKHLGSHTSSVFQ